jgi:hypothetical protein
MDTDLRKEIWNRRERRLVEMRSFALWVPLFSCGDGSA